MSRNPVNDNGLSKNIPDSVKNWYHFDKEIKKLKNKQNECIKDIEAEYKSAKEQGYTEEEIKELVDIIIIFSI